MYSKKLQEEKAPGIYKIMFFTFPTSLCFTECWNGFYHVKYGGQFCPSKRDIQSTLNFSKQFLKGVGNGICARKKKKRVSFVVEPFVWQKTPNAWTDHRTRTTKKHAFSFHFNKGAYQRRGHATSVLFWGVTQPRGPKCRNALWRKSHFLKLHENQCKCSETKIINKLTTSTLSQRRGRAPKPSITWGGVASQGGRVS